MGVRAAAGRPAVVVPGTAGRVGVGVVCRRAEEGRNTNPAKPCVVVMPAPVLRGINHAVDALLLDERQDHAVSAQESVVQVPAARDLRGRGCRSGGRGQRQSPLGVEVIVDAEAELLEIVAAGRPAGGLPGCLDRWQQQADEGADDRDHDQEFHEGEPLRCPVAVAARRPHTLANCTIRS